MVRLVPMTESEFEAYLARDTGEYAEENVKAGYWNAAEALDKSRAGYQRLLPNGLATQNHHIYTIEDIQSGEKVGMIWLAVDCESATPVGFIYNLHIDEQFRHRGFAMQAMLALEEKANELGLVTLRLHVFAHNDVARSLNEKLDYEVTSLNMAKRLSLKDQGK
jgi:ribosomal protein S18 acetylase RimI-like enzyme